MSEPPQASSIDSPPPNSPPSVGPGVGHHRISATSANTISIALKQDFGLKINPTPLEEHDVEVSDEPAPEQGRFNDLVRELNEGRYRSGVFVKLFTWLKEIFTHYDRKADLVQRSFNGVQNQEALMVAAFNSVASQENRENIKENMGNLLRFCQTADPNSICKWFRDGCAEFCLEIRQQMFDEFLNEFNFGLAKWVIDGRMSVDRLPTLSEEESSKLAKALLARPGGPAKLVELFVANKVTLKNFPALDRMPHGQVEAFAKALLDADGGPAKLAELVAAGKVPVGNFSTLSKEESSKLAQALLGVNGGPAKLAELVADGKVPVDSLPSLTEEESSKLVQALLGVNDGPAKLAELVAARKVPVDNFPTLSEVPPEKVETFAKALLALPDGPAKLAQLVIAGKVPVDKFPVLGEALQGRVQTFANELFHSNQGKLAELVAAGKVQPGNLFKMVSGFETFAKALLALPDGPAKLAEWVIADKVSVENFPALGEVQPGQVEAFAKALLGADGGPDKFAQLVKDGKVPVENFPVLTGVQQDKVGEFAKALLARPDGPDKFARLVAAGKVPVENFPALTEASEGQVEAFIKALLGADDGPARLVQLIADRKVPVDNFPALSNEESSKLVQASTDKGIVGMQCLTALASSKHKLSLGENHVEALIQVQGGIGCLAGLAQMGKLQPLEFGENKSGQFVQALIKYPEGIGCLAELAKAGKLQPLKIGDHPKARQFAQALIQRSVDGGIGCLAELVGNGLLSLPKLKDTDSIVELLVSNVSRASRALSIQKVLNDSAYCLAALAKGNLLSPLFSGDYRRAGEFAKILITQCRDTGISCLIALIEKDLLPFQLRGKGKVNDYKQAALDSLENSNLYDQIVS